MFFFCQVYDNMMYLDLFNSNDGLFYSNYFTVLLLKILIPNFLFCMIPVIMIRKQISI